MYAQAKYSLAQLILSEQGKGISWGSSSGILPGWGVTECPRAKL